jgi:ABC-type phosphate transport system substrate-binding protein
MNRSCSGVLLLVVAWAYAGAASGQESNYKVIVNAANPIGTVSRTLLKSIFLKQVEQWPNGQAAQAVDQAEGVSIRGDFSAEVLGRNVPAVKSYWQRQIFSGAAVPPVEKQSDGEVISFVRINTGGVGYVSASTPLPATIKVLRVTE